MKIRAVLLSTKPGGIFEMKALPDSYDEAKDYFTKLHHAQKKGEKVTQSVEIKKWYKHRSGKQNRLLFQLCTFLSHILFNGPDYKELIYYALIDKYADKVMNPLTHEEMPVCRGSEMDTVQFAKVVNGAFVELSELEIPIQYAEEIGIYWREFIEAMYAHSSDPLEIKSIEDYRKSVTSCEASGKYLGHYGEDDYCGQIAHIKSDGSGGELTPNNVLHLHAHVHVPDQHQHGWGAFLEKYPHLRKKVERALGYTLASSEPPENEPESDLRISGSVSVEELDIF